MMEVNVMSKIKSYGIIFVVALSAILGTGIVFACDEPIDIRIAPSTLNLDKAGACEDPCVTVHAEIPLSEVEVSDLNSLTLSGSKGTVTAIGTDDDDRGYLVVKFDRAEVKGIVEVGKNVPLTLTGETKEGESFTGTDTIRVKR